MGTCDQSSEGRTPDRGKHPANPPPRAPTRSELMARAFDLGVERYKAMTVDQLLAAIREKEEALGRLLQ